MFEPKGPNSVISLSSNRIGIVIDSRKHGQHIAIVDAEDYSEISKYRWCLNCGPNTFYAMTNVKRDGKKTTLMMHRLLDDSGVHVDHEDMNGLNNVRENLRPCSFSENYCNRRLQSNSTSGLKGVSAFRDKWKAEVNMNGHHHYLGLFRSAYEAAQAYDKKAEELHGEFAITNKRLGLLGKLQEAA